MTIRRNRYDTRDSLELGDRAEAQFARLALARGWQLKAATARQDIDEHWDWLISKGAEYHRVDVKAMKRINRRDSQVQSDWIWIELHGVRARDPGWLYGGKADWIAFEQARSFVIVPHKDLVKLISKLVDLKSRVASAQAARYKVYQRAGRPDRITLIESLRLGSIKVADWEKEKQNP